MDIQELTGRKYYSCTYLENHVGIMGYYLAHCCMGPISYCCDLDGNQFPFDAVWKAKTELIIDNQTDKTTQCKGCPYLVEKKWDLNRNGQFNLLTINDWYECNLRCDYCYTKSSEWKGLYKSNHNLILLIEDMIQNRYLSPNAVIHWGGGEVTIYKYFETVAKKLMDYGCYQLVNTNAIIISPLILDGLKNKHITLQISVDSGTKDTYKNVKGVDRFDQVWENISKYAQTGAVCVKYVLYNKNSNDADIYGFIDLCKQNHVRCIKIVPEYGNYVDVGISNETQLVVRKIINYSNKLGIYISNGFPKIKETNVLRRIINKFLSYYRLIRFYIYNKNNWEAFYKIHGIR